MEIVYPNGCYDMFKSMIASVPPKLKQILFLHILVLKLLSKGNAGQYRNTKSASNMFEH